MSEHTPLPWKVSELQDQFSFSEIEGPADELGNGEIIGATGGAGRKANAALIVLAVNNHFDLVGTVETMLSLVRRIAASSSLALGDDVYRQIHACQALLDRVKGT
jgi:hypothetical protein